MNWMKTVVSLSTLLNNKLNNYIVFEYNLHGVLYKCYSALEAHEYIKVLVRHKCYILAALWVVQTHRNH